MAVDGNDAVGVLVDHRALGVHAEGAHLVPILPGAVDDLAFIELVRQVREDLRRQLHPDTDVHPVGLGRDVQLPANLLHPLAAAAAYGDDALFAGEGFLGSNHLIAPVYDFHLFHRGVEEEIHLILQIVIQVFQHHIVDVRAQMADGGIQQMQVVLDAGLLELGAGGGVELGTRAAVAHVDFVHIAHQLQGLTLADILKERAAKVVGNVVFSVGEGTGAAETAHNGAGFAADAGLYLFSVDGAVTAGKGVTCLDDRHLFLRAPLGQLISGIDAAGAGTDNQNVVIHGFPPKYSMRFSGFA